jgi:myo-inositol 2-dehydrogenase / D-chiro-inositol 1-dehydrogenase
LGWKRAIDADFSFEPRECDFKTEPPVKPGPDGLYPVAIPGKTHLIPGI